MNADRAQVRVQPEAATQREESLFRPNRSGRIRPLRSADRAQEDRIGRPAGLDVLWSNRHAVGIDRRSADEVLGPVDREAEGHSGGIDRGPRGRDDVRPDAVARDSRDPIAGRTVRHGNSSAARRPMNATSSPLTSAPWSLLTATR